MPHNEPLAIYDLTHPMPRLLVIPDIHTYHEPVEAIIARARPDVTVFLGDYFDQFHDSPQENRVTAQWLKQSLAQPNRVHLWGNHDTHYAFPGEHTICGGYTRPKDKAINEIITAEEWCRLRLYHLAEGFLFTHAGLHRHFVPANRSLEEFLAQTEREALRCLRGKTFHWSLTPGYIRSGWQIYGGITWCDWDEFQPVPGVNQVFGHTPGREPRIRREPDSYSLCLDTTLPSLGIRHFAIIENREVEVVEVER